MKTLKRIITQKELKEILTLHRDWLAGKDTGKKACLKGCNLMELNFSDADLREVDLRFSDLTGANLDGADLRNAKIEGANLKLAGVEGINLEGAELYTGAETWIITKGKYKNNKVTYENNNTGRTKENS